MMILKISLLLIFGSMGISTAQEPPVKPNLLLFISDDQGYGDFGFTGNKVVQTPHLDRMAKESAVYQNFVVNPACSPTRAALFTGRDVLLTGTWGVGSRAGLRDDEVRMPLFYKKSGYQTIHVGKLDSVKTGKGPTEFGWDQWMGCGNYQQRDPLTYSSNGNRQDQGWTVEIWTDEVIRFIRQNSQEPWFASVAYIIPHMPWVCDEKYQKKFLDQGYSKNLAECYGSIAHMDECIGRILDCIKETGQDSRTIVAFLSDNGPSSPERKEKNENGFYNDPDWKVRNAAGLRGHKTMVYENGIRVPLLIRWPGKIPPGERRQFAAVEDLLPTLLDLSGIRSEVIPHLPFSGKSFIQSVYQPDSEEEREEVLRMTISGPGSPQDLVAPGEKRSYEDHHLSLRGKRYNFHTLPNGKKELYDIQADPGEITDIKDKYPEIVIQMDKKCRQKWEEILSSGRAFAEFGKNEKSKKKD